MKTTKISFILILLFLASGWLPAQEYKIAVQNTKDGKISFKDFSGDLPVEGYNGNEIIITASSDDFTPPEKAKGLKAIYPSGTDNTGIGLDVQKTGNQVSVTCLIPFTRGGEYKLRVPENMALEFESGCERSNRIIISGTRNEIDIDNCHDISLKDVTGPLVLSTIGGDIDVSFSSINSEKPFSVTSISGDIDINLPAKTSTNLELHTINGAFYSDFEFPDTQKDLKRVGGSELNFALNGGGFKFRISTISGNVYLRKAK